jgi:glucose-6-phosphate isomerase
MIIKSAHLRELFADDPLRSTTMKINAGDLTLDFSHQRITTDTLTQLDKINQTMGLKERLHALFRGDIVNPSEARPALHTALRDRDTTPIVVDGQDIKPLIKKNLDEMFALCKTIWQSGITDVLVLGIGGSYWGSLNVCEALRHLPKRLNIHFLGDNEQEAFDYVTDKLIPQKTVVLIISKSFTTNETIRNAHFQYIVLRVPLIVWQQRNWAWILSMC